MDRRHVDSSSIFSEIIKYVNLDISDDKDVNAIVRDLEADIDDNVNMYLGGITYAPHNEVDRFIENLLHSEYIITNTQKGLNSIKKESM
jgi:hypothetical protein